MKSTVTTQDGDQVTTTPGLIRSDDGEDIAPMKMSSELLSGNRQLARFMRSGMASEGSI